MKDMIQRCRQIFWLTIKPSKSDKYINKPGKT